MRVFIICLFSGFFFGSAIAQQNQVHKFEEYANRVRGAQLTPQESSFVVTSGYKSATSDITHIYFSQELHGVEVVGTESSLHIALSGNEVSRNINFIENQGKKQQLNNTPAIAVLDGFEKAIQSVGYSSAREFEITSEAKTSKKIEFVDSAMTFSMANATLKWLRGSSEELNLVWQYLLQDEVTGAGWTVFVDAHQGRTLQILDWVQECAISEPIDPMVIFPQPEKMYDSSPAESLNCSNCYEVIALPFESPYEAERQVVTEPSHPLASPRGWHYFDSNNSSRSNTTTGNNVIAFDGNDNYGYQPNGGEDLDFTGYEFGDEYSESNQFESASITNVFYLANRVHDILYVYGFDESSGNFQTENFTTNGMGNDPIEAKVQKSSSKCNSSFGVGPDGAKGVMTTNICRGRDADFDATVIIHEYGHGIYGRLTGGANSTDCLYNAERTVEGVADWYAIMLTMKEDDVEDKTRQIAKFFFNQGPDGSGVRNYPYSTDFAKNPQTYNDIGTASVPHGVGAVWANMLWEMTWQLVNRHGFNEDLTAFTGDYNEDAGNIMALALVTEGLKLQPCEPGFVTARDAILRADQAIYQGRNSCYIWRAFAKRGLGIDAGQGSQDIITDGVESYEEPSPYANIKGNFFICYKDEIVTGLTGGLPYGGVYSGPGVIDNGDGLSFNLDMAAAGPGEHEIMYEVMDSECSIASSDVATLRLTVDETAPQITCINDFVIEITTESLPQIPYYDGRTITFDDCDEFPEISQTPAAGGIFSLGENLVTMSSKDDSGNISKCSFNVLVKRVSIPPSVVDASIQITPNPSHGRITLYNDLLLDLKRVRFFDIRGRLIKTIPLSTGVEVYQFSMEEFETGLYFISIENPYEPIVKRIIKR